MTAHDNFYVFWPLIAFTLLYGIGEAIRSYFYWRRRQGRN
jgi:hypothetical protein